jgi:O-antigen ligase
MSLKQFFYLIKFETKQNPLFLLVILVLLSIPMYYEINSICFGLVIFATIFTFKKSNFLFDKKLLLPIGLYFLMVLSVFWTIDIDKTIPALSKELSLFIIPVCFMIFGGFDNNQKSKIIQNFSYGMLGFAIFYLLKALVRYFITGKTNGFFFHELVTKDVNAIHVSVFMTIAFFYFFTKTLKSKLDYFAIIILSTLIFLLSSKNIIAVFIFLLIIYHLYYSKSSNQLRLKNLMLFAIILVCFFSFNKIKSIFEIEFQTNTNKSINANVVEEVPLTVHNISIKEAWTDETFTPNDFFPGTAFRVYQFRIFLEMIQEKGVFFTGYGLNASYKKIEEKALEYNLYLGDKSHEGYQKKNFHNQYVQNFIELGVVGFILLIIMLGINLKNAIKNRNFIHISFSILMISLFLTETFLWRQRGVVFFTIMYCVFNIKIIAPEDAKSQS